MTAVPRQSARRRRPPVRRQSAAQQAAQQLTLVDAPTARRRTGMSEDELLEAIRRLAKLTGWLMFHCRDSRKSIGAGFPDLVLVSPRRARIIFAELKDDTNTTSAAQDMWLDALALTTVEVALWRPIDLPDIAAVLRGDRHLDYRTERHTDPDTQDSP
jgi:hypothetical protein